MAISAINVSRDSHISTKVAALSIILFLVTKRKSDPGVQSYLQTFWKSPLFLSNEKYRFHDMFATQ